MIPLELKSKTNYMTKVEQTLEQSDNSQESSSELGGKRSLNSSDTDYLNSFLITPEETTETSTEEEVDEDQNNESDTDEETTENNESENEDEVDETESEEEDEREADEEQSEQTLENTTMELVVNGETKPFDLSDPEQFKKVKDLAQLGDNYQIKVEELNKQTSAVGEREAFLQNTVESFAFSMLFQKGRNAEPPKESDYISEKGKFYKQFENDEDAYEAYKKDKDEYLKALPLVEEFKKDFSTTQQKYVTMVDKFRADHPEIKDMNSWIIENLGPYHEPIQTFGKKSYPDDTLEMIYYYKNRDKIEEEIRQDERRRLATKSPTKKPSPTKKISQKPKKGDEALKDKVNENITRIMKGGKEIKFVH